MITLGKQSGVAALEFGALPIHGPGARMHASGCWYEIADDSMDFGSSEAITEVVKRFWADGSDVLVEGADNAVTSFRLRIGGDSLNALSDGEEAFRMQFPTNEHAVPLTWRPGGVGVPAAVRTMLHVSMRLIFDGLAEAEMVMRRIFEVTVTHEPFVRSEFETVVEALPADPTPTDLPVELIPAEWTFGIPKASTSSVSLSGGVLVASATLIPGSPYHSTFDWRLSHVAPIVGDPDMPYLVVTHRLTGTGITNHGAGISASYVPSTPGAAPVTLRRMRSGTLGGTLRYTIFLVHGALPALTLSGRTVHNVGTLTTGVRVEEIRFTNNPHGSRRDIARVFSVGGTEETRGVARIASPDGTTRLGTVILHSTPVHCPGFDASLMQDRVSEAAPEPDPTAPAGHWVRIDSTSMQIKRDISMVCKGSYVFVAYLRSELTVTVQVFANTIAVAPGGAFAFEDVVTSASTTTTLTAGVPKMVVLGITEWLTIDTGSGDAAVFCHATGASQVDIGGLWAFPIGDGASLTIANTNSPFMWIRSGDATSPPRVRVNTVDDEASGWTPGRNAILAGPDLRYFPGEVRASVVTSGVDDAVVSHRFYQRFPYHPTSDGSTS